MSVLTFREEDHTYWLDGLREVPSVSEVLKQARVTADLSKIPPKVLERKRNIGTALHKAAEYLIEGTLDRESLDFALLPYFKGLEKFFVEKRPDVISYEAMGWNEDLWVAGTWDLRYASQNGEGDHRTDYKTTYAKYASWGPQLALYDEIDGHTNRDVLWLKKDGTYALLPYQDDEDYSIGCAAALLYNWRKERKLL